MKYVLLVLAFAAFTSISLGLVLELDYSEKLIGFGVSGLFLIVFPVFAYLRWKDKEVKDYMLTQENLDKMRDNQRKKKY